MGRRRSREKHELILLSFREKGALDTVTEEEMSLSPELSSPGRKGIESHSRNSKLQKPRLVECLKRCVGNNSFGKFVIK